MVVFNSTIDSEQIDGAFALAVDVRLATLSSGSDQTVFEYSDASGQNTVTLSQVGSSADLAFTITNAGVAYTIVAEDALLEGEYATYRVGVDPSGTMRIAKNTALLIEEEMGPAAVPIDVDRSQLIGESSTGTALDGDVLNLKLANYGDVNDLDPRAAESPCAITGEAKCLCDKLFVEGEVKRGEDGPLFLPTHDAEGDGEFTTVQSLGGIPVHAMLMPDGKVLSFGVGSQGNRADSQFVYSLYDPETGIDTVLANTTSVDLFCSNMSIDPVTGNVLIMGSGDFENDAVVFDYTTQTIRDAEHGDMVHDRWYGQSATMANGEVFIIGGQSSAGPGSDIPEVWTAETGWRELTDAKVPGVSGDWWYPHTYVNSSNQIVILDAQGRDIHRVTTEGSGSVEHIGTLPFAGDNQQPSIMIETDTIARIDNAGGLWIIDIGGEVPSFEKVADTGSNRHDGGMIALPDGTVMITGGQTGGAWNRVENADYSTLIWDPKTNEITEIGETLNIARLYHSTYVMLPDGTVWIGGGGVAGAINNANFEIYVPSYLFDENGERIVQAEIDAPSNIQAGDTFQITVEDANAIDRLTATKAGAWTHARNSDSRFLELDFAVVDATTIEVSTPPETILIPGAWTFYALDANGVPSMGDIVGVNMAPLVDTATITSQSEIYGIDDDKIEGAFEIKVDVRFDDLEADVRMDGRDTSSIKDNAGQVVFDIGNGSEDGNRMQGSNISGVIDYFYSDNIVLWQVGRRTDMAFSVFDGSTEYRIIAEDVLVEGELATWTVGVDTTGIMRLWKDDVLVAEGQGVVPNNVERKVVKVGESSWDIANDLRGKIANLEIVNTGDDPEFVHFGLPKASLSDPRFVTDSGGEIKQIIFDLTLDSYAFAVVSADIAISGPATGPAQVVIPSGGTSAQIVLDYFGKTTFGVTDPVSLSLSNISQARAGSTLEAFSGPADFLPEVTQTTYLSDLDTLVENSIHRGLIRDVGYYGEGIQLDGVTYAKGLTMHPTRGGDTYVEFAVVPGADVFRATIGIEDDISYSAARFDVLVDGVEEHRQFLFTNASRAYDIEIDVEGASVIRLQTDEGLGNAGAVAVWADARFETLEKTHDFTGYIQGEDFTWTSGHYNTGDQVFNLDTFGQTIRFVDDDSVMDDDVNSTDQPTDWTQYIELNGERYTAYVEKIMTYTDGVNTYKFAAIDADLNGNDRWGNEVGELYTVIAQVEGPKVALGTDLRQVSFEQIDIAYADIDARTPKDISYEFTGFRRELDFTLDESAPQSQLDIIAEGRTLRFIDDDSFLNAGLDVTGIATDRTQWIEIDGERYAASVDDLAIYADGRATYQFATIDVDLNQNDVLGDTPAELTSLIAQVSGPSAQPGQELNYQSEQERDIVYGTLDRFASTVYLSDLDPADVSATHRNLGLMRDVDYFGNEIDLGGVRHEKGVMVVPRSFQPASVTYDLNGAQTFKADVGIEDWVTQNASVVFSVEVDGIEVFDSGQVTHSESALAIEIDVSGGSELTLIADPLGSNNSDHPVWASARLEYASAILAPLAPPPDPDPAGFGAIRGFVFNDLTGNDVYDSGEGLEAGVSVILRDAGGAAVASGLTNGFGIFKFDDVAYGDYTLEVQLGAGQVFVTPDQGTIEGRDSDITDTSAGLTDVFTIDSEDIVRFQAGVFDDGSVIQFGDIRGYVFNDQDGDGIYGASDLLEVGVTVELRDDAGGFVANTSTSAAGLYRFDDVAFGTYTLAFQIADGLRFVTADQGTIEGRDSDVTNAATGQTDAFALNAEEIFRFQAGVEYNPDVELFGSVRGYVFNDNTGDGFYNDGDNLQAGTVVRLVDDGFNEVATAVTNGFGSYRFDDVAVGTYLLEFELADGLVFVPADQGTAGGRDSDVTNLDLGRTDVFNVSADEIYRVQAGVDELNFA